MEKQLKPESNASANVLSQTLATFRAIIMSPREFFQNMPLEGGLQDPAVFLLIVSAVSSVGVLLVTQNPMQAMQELVVRLVISVASAAYLLVLSRGLGGTGSFEATFRAFAYAAAPAIISWVPLVNLIAGIYGLFLMRLGLEKVHGLSMERAVAAVAIWFVTLIGVMAVIAGIMAAILVRPHETVPGI